MTLLCVWVGGWPWDVGRVGTGDVGGAMSWFWWFRPGTPPSTLQLVIPEGNLFHKTTLSEALKGLTHLSN